MVYHGLPLIKDPRNKNKRLVTPFCRATLVSLFALPKANKIKSITVYGAAVLAGVRMSKQVRSSAWKKRIQQGDEEQAWSVGGAFAHELIKDE